MDLGVVPGLRGERYRYGLTGKDRDQLVDHRRYSLSGVPEVL